MPRPNTGPRLKWIDKRQSFYVVWYERGRERSRSARTADRRVAETVLAQFIGQTHRGPTGPRNPGDILISDVVALYWREHAPTVADPDRIGYAAVALLKYWTGTVATITPSTCTRYARKRNRAPATVRRELGTLKAAIHFAVKEGYLTTTVPVTMPEKPPGKERWLTHSEAARLLIAARNAPKARAYLPLFILIGLYTGARKEAILSLKWPQVDLERGRINFAKPGVARTNKGRAHISVPRQLLVFLKLAWRRRSSDLGPVIHIDGKPIASIKSSWRSAIQRADLAGVTPHTLRHTCATWMAQRGVPLWDIAGWLGQSIASTTELYAHADPNFMEAAKKAAERRK